MSRVVLKLHPVIHLTHEQLFQLCMANMGLHFVLTTQGELIIVSPDRGDSGNQEAELITDLGIWNRQTKLGKVFSSSTIFRLPNGAERLPNAAWVKLDRWNALTAVEQAKFHPLCPDFLIELRSATDSLKPIQQKMQEYLENGLRLGWLINPQHRQVEIYRPNHAAEVISLPAQLSGEDVLPEFVLDLA